MPQTINVGSRSLFVTVTAWAFIVAAALASAAALVQNAAVSSFLPQWRADAAALPLLTGWLLGYLPWVVGAGFAFAVSLLACAVGLLVRLEWARRIFIVLLLVTIAANLAGLWLQHEVVQTLVASTLQAHALPPQAAGVFGGFAAAAQLLGVSLTLAGCALLGWIVRRLMSDAVRQEFA
jgi:hypothetical protein